MTSTGDSAEVRYGVKELLHDIRNSITAVDVKLDNKADKADVAVLVQTQQRTNEDLKELRFRVDWLEKTKVEAKDSRRFKIPLAISVSALFISPFIWDFVNHLPWK